MCKISKWVGIFTNTKSFKKLKSELTDVINIDQSAIHEKVFFLLYTNRERVRYREELSGSFICFI